MSYTVKIDNFSGPMDLLLYLVKQQEVEIHEIRISEICDRYLEFMKAMEVLNVDLAADFLVMASTMMLIKSRSLLPVEEELDLEEELDPEDELIQQLLEYKRFKVATRDLDDLAHERREIFPLIPPRRKREEVEIPIEDIDLFDLVKAFSTLLKETGLDRSTPHKINTEKPLREYMDEVFTILRSHRRISFSGLFEGMRDRDSIIGRFLALLELVRQKRLSVIQEASFDSIDIELQDDKDLSDEEWDEAEVTNSSAVDDEVDSDLAEREFADYDGGDPVNQNQAADNQPQQHPGEEGGSPSDSAKTSSQGSMESGA